MALWQDDTDILFCGDISKYGVFSNETAEKLQYNEDEVVQWKPQQEVIQSSVHFEQQYQLLLLQIYHSICLGFIKNCTSSLLEFSQTDDSSCCAQIIEASVEFIKIVACESLPKIVVSQIVSGMFRQTVCHIESCITKSPDSLCNSDTGVHLKLNLTSLLDLLGEEDYLSPYSQVIELVFGCTAKRI